ncbi:hypothetical protein ACH42_09500 [Endozoicomonas sp. (ex Bugula neritina AB1)]|nr:hypothetical protein ACH42_09500 [Endozoicomonas sp. (ex Bugula neritina AB1)]
MLLISLVLCHEKHFASLFFILEGGAKHFSFAMGICDSKKVLLSRPNSPIRRSFAKLLRATKFCAILRAVYEISGLRFCRYLFVMLELLNKQTDIHRIL